LSGRGWRWCRMSRRQALCKMAVAAALFLSLPAADAQGPLTRKVITKVAPDYPELARQANINITGKVRVLVVVARNGTIRDSKVLGGHPLLVSAAMKALKQWKFEAADEETTGTVEFDFKPK